MRIQVSIVMLLTVLAGCDRLTGSHPSLATQIGSLRLTAIDSAGAEVSVIRMNESGTVLGNLLAGSESKAFRWESGTFTILQPAAGAFVAVGMNNAGDVVGTLDHVPVVWTAGTSAPTPMFRSDTTLGNIFLGAINDRGEVVMNTSPGGSGFWRAGEFKAVSTGGCVPDNILNDNGLSVFQPCGGDLYTKYETVASPFGVLPVTSHKLAGRSCNFGEHGANAIGIVALNDSNEVIDAGGNWRTDAGCQSFKLQLTAFNTRGLLAGVANGKAILLTLDGTVNVDDLLDTATRSEWTVLTVTRLTDDRHMLARATRVSDGKTLDVSLVPK